MIKFRFKRIYVFFTAVVAFLIHLPFAFGHAPFISEWRRPVTVTTATDNNYVASVSKIYDSLKLNLCGLSQNAFNTAVKGFAYLKEQGKIVNDNVLSIVDFSRPSTQKRLFVLDLRNYKVLFNTYVAHGQGSGAEMATTFSNQPESLQSSLGFYETEDTYIGKNGFSLHLAGLEKGINDKAEERAIVMHGAPYVSEDFIRSRGYLGRSWGCPAVPEQLSGPIINKIKNGTCLFIYSPSARYLQASPVLRRA